MDRLEGRGEPLLEYDSWSPRGGVAYQIGGNTVVKTSVSRMGEKFALDFAFSFFPNSVVGAADRAVDRARSE